MLKNCTNCPIQFKIEDEDQIFYKKLGISAPQQCPKCRLIRRMAWRNDRAFYKRKCDASAEEFVSMYPEETPFPVYKPSAWYSDSWDGLDYGQEFNFERPFFEQWQELMLKVPRIGIDIVGCENSDYCNYCGYDRNCYLDIAGENNEDSYYNLFVKYSKNTVDCTFTYNSELCYEAINCHNCYDVRFSSYLENCNNCYFSFDLKGCSDCLFSSNLRQKQYYIFNQPHSREEYEAKLKQLNLGSHQRLQIAIQNWQKVMQNAIHRDAYINNSQACSGNNIKNSKNSQFVFNVLNCEDSKYLFDVLDAKDCYDLNYSLYNPELSCELISTLEMKFSAFSMASHHCNDVFYCDMCNSCKDCFGCIGLTQKQYCILNKQYSKEDYEKLKAKIIEHMKKSKEWGEFFPVEMSPHAYNNTVAQEYYPLTRDQALSKNYKWEDKVVKHNTGENYKLPDKLSDLDKDLPNKVLSCESCTKGYKVIQQELRFYKKQGLAIPRKCPDCRHLSRMSRRTPRSLWKRNCSSCSKSIHTAYSPNRKENVFCETCYLEEVY